MSENPKLKDSLMIECIPQVGDCPMRCAECYYNLNFYRSKDTPLLPTLEESEGKIVRVNSGHDSNLQRELVLEKTKDYKDKFYNTSIPIPLGAPTILTLNGRDTDKTFLLEHEFGTEEDTIQLMAVRFRVNTWNLGLCWKAISHWALSDGTPLILTPMRYASLESIPESERKFYSQSKHIINTWWCLNEDGVGIIRHKLAHSNVFWCGNPFNNSSYCSECRICEHLYVSAKERMKLHTSSEEERIRCTP